MKKKMKEPILVTDWEKIFSMHISMEDLYPVY